MTHSPELATCPDEPRCRQCGHPIPLDAPQGVCPVCLGSVLSGAFSAFTPVLTERDFPVLANFEIRQLLGQGAMGVVFRAWQKNLQREVAVKMILSGNLASAAEVELFQKEARAAAKLQHPNIVAIHDVGEENGQHYYSMALVEGCSLARMINGTPLPAARACEYMIKIAQAVHYAHQQKIVHLDLKPANILMDRQNEPHVADFGLAREFTGRSLQTESGRVIGTPAYMSPEQAAGRKAGPAADVYGLGALLYEMLTGRPPFKAETMLLTLRQVNEAEPASPRAINPAVPRDLATICLKCLRKDPHRRYASAAELAEDLGRFTRGEVIHARPAGWLERGVRWARRHPVPAMGISSVLLLLLSLSIAAFLFRRYSLQTNEHVAQLSAAYLRDYIDGLTNAVVQTAASPVFKELLARRDIAGLSEFLNDTDRRTVFQDPEMKGNWVITDPQGRTILRRPEVQPPFTPLESRTFRDYWRGTLETATRGAGQIHISEVYLSLEDGDYKFSLGCGVGNSAEPEKIEGLLFLMIKARSPQRALGLSHGQQETVVIGKFDPGPLRVAPEQATNYVIWLHPTFTNGHPAVPLVAWNPPKAATVRNYRDPAARLYPAYSGPFLAGVASVRETGFMVIVQTRDWVAWAVTIFGVTVGVVLCAYAFWRLVLKLRPQKSP